MLPYTPMHHLLFASGAPSPLVVTSANRCNEPTIYREEDAQAKLPQLADSILQGERPIVRRVDDSVVTIRDGEPLMVRRARGYAPDSVCSLPTDQTILAVGSDLKNSIALVHKGEVFIGPHLGNLGTEDSNREFAAAVSDLLAMHDLRSRDVIVAHDRQSDLSTSRFAKSLPAKMHIAIQHHSAHIASVLAERQVFDERVVGVALDGAEQAMIVQFGAVKSSSGVCKRGFSVARGFDQSGCQMETRRHDSQSRPQPGFSRNCTICPTCRGVHLSSRIGTITPNR